MLWMVQHSSFCGFLCLFGLLWTCTPGRGDLATLGGDQDDSLKEAESVIPSQNPQSCNSKVLVLVLSDVRHQPKRDAVRKSWVRAIQQLEGRGTIGKGSVQAVFIVGRLKKKIAESSVAEAKEHKDLIVADQDDYDFEQYTSKVAWAIRWALKHCQFEVLLKVSDDDFVNVALLIQKWLPSAAKEMYTGVLISGARPIRDENNAWFMPKEYFPGESYPSYVEKSYALSESIARRLNKALTKDLEKIYYDDVATALALKGEKVEATRDKTFVVLTRPETGDKCKATVVLNVPATDLALFAQALQSSKDGSIC